MNSTQCNNSSKYISLIKHIEYIHPDYFSAYHFTKNPDKRLSTFISYYWETNFDALWKQYPKGFTDVVFPDIGYTYLVNLGTPFLMTLPDKKFEMKIDCFLPRTIPAACWHKPGNKIFGVKFKISPLIFQKKIDFSEYRNSMYSLSYLIDRSVLKRIKNASDFKERVKILDEYYVDIVSQHQSVLHFVNIVSKLLDDFTSKSGVNLKVEEIAKKYKVEIRTLQRYFLKAIGISPKKALQLIRVRNAVSHLCEDPGSFQIAEYGYFDYSHFYKDIKKFVSMADPEVSRSYLILLDKLRMKN